MHVLQRDTIASLEFDFQSFLQASHEFLKVANEYEALGHTKLATSLRRRAHSYGLSATAIAKSIFNQRLLAGLF